MRELKDELREFFAGVYEIDDELKGGGMSRLFLATDNALHRRVVIKILPPDFSSEVMAARFKREAQLTASLQHPHILPVISAGSANGLLYYVMPFVDGESLRARLTREGALPVHDAVRLLHEIADALAHAHAHGVIHRDIKPENILLQGDHAVVADFGIAGALDSGARPRLSGPTRLTSTGISLGTVGYMAPEQSVGERNVDARADVYSLGVVGYEMIAGRRLFEGESAQEVIAAHLTKKPVPLDRVAEGVPMPVVMAIEKALEKNPEERFQNATEFREALRSQASAMTTMTRAVPAAIIRGAKRRAALMRSRRVLGIAAIALIALGAGAAWWRMRASAVAPTDIVRVAVVPFDVVSIEPVWREGMVDLMARDLDGAGTLHTIPPAVILRGWRGKSDRESARAAAQRTGAAYALYGSIFPSTGDAATLRAELLDVRADSVILADFKRTGVEIPKLADSLAMTVIAELLKRNNLGAVARPAPRGTSSVDALRFFLQGEQQFRSTKWDSALTAYRRASDADSVFALAFHRQSQILGWMKNVDDSVSKSLAFRAGRLNHGLGPRDSLLVAADSLSAAATTLGVINGTIVPKLMGVLELAARTYPDDPEVWYLLGEARYHVGFGSLGAPNEAVLEAFDRSIALDSSFGPAYLHTAELALQVRDAAAARAYADRYVVREPNGTDASALRLVSLLLDPSRSRAAATQRTIDTLPWDDLHRAFLDLRRWPDSSFAALRILNAAGRRPVRADAYSPDTSALRSYLPLELAFRGRVNDAFAATRSTPTRLLPELALLGVIPADTAGALFHSWLSSGHPSVRSALPWWALRRDTASIRAFARRSDSTAKAAAQPRARSLAAYNVRASDAYLTLARGDTVGALAKFAALSDTACSVCYVDRLIEAQLNRALGRLARADTLLAYRPNTLLSPLEVLVALERGEIARLRQRPLAAEQQAQLVVSAWASGDASLQPYIRRARGVLENINQNPVAPVTARR